MKQKIHFIITLLLLGGIVYLFIQDQKRPKFAYIDSTRVFIEYNETKKAKEEYEKEYLQWQTKYDTLVTEYNHLISVYRNDSTKMSAEELNLLKINISKKVNQMEIYKNSIQNLSTERDKELSEKVNAKINSFITKYGANNHYTIIFGATQMGNIIYGEKIVDITDVIIEELNKGE